MEKKSKKKERSEIVLQKSNLSPTIELRFII